MIVYTKLLHYQINWYGFPELRDV